MSYSIVYSPSAIRDLDCVYAEVMQASKDIGTAIKYIDELMDHIAQKRDYPKSASLLYYEGDFTGYYFVVFKAYIAFYRVDTDHIYVDRVVYGRSDYMRYIIKQ